MFSSTNQNKVISNLNKYLEWDNLPIRLNKSGVCNGLSTVFAKYVIEGKKDRFLEMLTYVAGKKIEADRENDVDQFIMEVILSHGINLFDKELAQRDGFKSITIDGEPLEPLFKMGMVTNDKNWVDIFKSIALQENEAMIIRSISHAVSVSRSGASYIVYDPNYSTGVKEYPNEKALINELHQNVFLYTGDLVGMNIDIVRQKSHSVGREFPAVDTLYDRYVKKENINSCATESFNNKSITNLNMAASINDPAAVKKLIELGATNEQDLATIISVHQKNLDTLKILIEKYPPDKDAIRALFRTAIHSGSLNTFNILNEKYPEVIPHIWESISAINDSDRTLCIAAHSSNVSLLEEIIRLTPSTKNYAGAISTAINGGSNECVTLLLKQLKLSEENKLYYLLEAIEKNHPTIVSTFTAITSAEYLKTINMTTTAVEKTNLSILRDLKEKGVTFSATAEGVIARKEKRPIGWVLSAGILLSKFTDFCKEILYADQEKYKIEQFYSYKERLAQNKNERPVEDNGSKDLIRQNPPPSLK